jgi:hypothetical protein
LCTIILVFFLVFTPWALEISQNVFPCFLARSLQGQANIVHYAKLNWIHDWVFSYICHSYLHDYVSILPFMSLVVNVILLTIVVIYMHNSISLF